MSDTKPTLPTRGEVSCPDPLPVWLDDSVTPGLASPELPTLTDDVTMPPDAWNSSSPEAEEFEATDTEKTAIWQPPHTEPDPIGSLPTDPESQALALPTESSHETALLPPIDSHLTQSTLQTQPTLAGKSEPVPPVPVMVGVEQPQPPTLSPPPAHAGFQLKPPPSKLSSRAGTNGRPVEPVFPQNQEHAVRMHPSPVLAVPSKLMLILMLIGCLATGVLSALLTAVLIR